VKKRPPISKLSIVFYFIALLWIGLACLTFYITTLRRNLDDPELIFAWYSSVLPRFLEAFATMALGILAQQMCLIRWSLSQGNRNA
jgi:hypothetical protein